MLLRKAALVNNRALLEHPSANQIREPRLSFEHLLMWITAHKAFVMSLIVISCVVIGCPSQGDKDFTPAAAQVAHQKPVPAVQKLPTAHHFNQHIHQPRKWALHNSRPPRPPAQGQDHTTPNTCSGCQGSLAVKHSVRPPYVCACKCPVSTRIMTCVPLPVFTCRSLQH